MDADFLKTVVPLVAGVLAFAGGLLTFINGRLKDAETPHQRLLVLVRTRLALEGCLCAVAVLLLISHHEILGLLVYYVWFGLQVRAFVKESEPMTRYEVLLMIMLTMVVGFLTASTLSNLEKNSSHESSAAAAFAPASAASSAR